MVDRNNPDFLSASTIKKDRVVNGAGENLGKIEELMIDLQDGRVAYAVLSFGGFLGMGNKLFAIPWQALKLKLHEHAFLLDIPKETLEKAEGFDKNNWPATNREWLSTMYSYYGYQPYWQTGAAAEAGISTGISGDTGSERMARMGSTAGRDNPEFLSASTIKGDKVVNRAGENLGKIEELMIDLQDGKVAYAVVSHGGFLGIGNKLFSIPWKALTPKLHEHAILLDIPKETLEKAEGFDKDKWPLTREELSSAYTYYGYQPYWQTGAVAAAGISTGMAGEIESERMARMETERQEPAETEAERKARQERERLEGLRGTQEETQRERGAQLEREPAEAGRQVKAESEKLTQLERERAEAGRQVKAESEKLTQLERERAEAERQAKTEREKLTQLERELQEATRREKTDEIVRIEKEMREVKMKEETQKERVAKLERELQEATRQTETGREKLAQLEREGAEAQRREKPEPERMSRIGGMEGRDSPEFMSASTIKSDRVINASGDELGKIEELMLDLENGRIAYAVLSFGGFLGMGNKMFAIPWQALKLRAHERAFALDVSKEILEKAEGFDKNNWPLSREELSRTYIYYGYQPYWQTGATRQTGMPGETESEMMARTKKERKGRLETAEEVMAGQEKERIEELEKKETDKEKLAKLEKERVIAERREHKYQ
jgi:sporulation protein YlmC with PRC-barrel domain